MAKYYGSFRKQVLEKSGLAATFLLYGHSVSITEDLKIFINSIEIESNVSTLEEARQYAKQTIENFELLETIDTTIPKEKIAHYIKEYHNVEKITETLIEQYLELASSNIFTVDPVVTAIKESRTAEFKGKLQYDLNDGSIVAIDESTQEYLNNILKNKPEIVDYMRESKNNFMRIIKELEE
jgi:hypothetical protein